MVVSLAWVFGLLNKIDKRPDKKFRQGFTGPLQKWGWGGGGMKTKTLPLLGWGVGEGWGAELVPYVG